MLVSSVPLSDTHVFGLPRIAMMVSSSRATRAPESEVSATSARHSRVQSSTTASARNRRPSVNVSETKSSDQRSFGRKGSAKGARRPRYDALQPELARMLQHQLAVAGDVVHVSHKLHTLRVVE